ncbi:MAG: hypothetical protein WAX29_03415 [Propionibacterium sp.]|uniref:hypothetical protein n=1 Tax=Bifidobacterium tibiigranuli TaxID=2172043 RepID=UPI002355C503|nr:hypothetical protein [Bifidobacterium tibiigranuli]MCH3973532.1 hypothetical protein [Bifidobacterium tibiigranuli]
MSSRAYLRACRTTVGSAEAKSLLLVLSESGPTSGFLSQGMVDRAAAMCELSPLAERLAMRRLRERGLLQPVSPYELRGPGCDWRLPLAGGES